MSNYETNIKSVICNECGKRYTVKPEYSGTDFACALCGNIIPIPSTPYFEKPEFESPVAKERLGKTSVRFRLNVKHYRAIGLLSTVAIVLVAFYFTKTRSEPLAGLSFLPMHLVAPNSTDPLGPNSTDPSIFGVDIGSPQIDDVDEQPAPYPMPMEEEPDYYPKSPPPTKPIPRDPIAYIAELLRTWHNLKLQADDTYATLKQSDLDLVRSSLQKLERVFDEREATEFLEKTDALNEFSISTCQKILAAVATECELKVKTQLNRLRDPRHYLPEIDVLRDDIIDVSTLARSVNEELEGKLGMSFTELAIKVNEIKSLQKCFFEIRELESLVNEVPIDDLQLVNRKRIADLNSEIDEFDLSAKLVLLDNIKLDILGGVNLLSFNEPRLKIAELLMNERWYQQLETLYYSDLLVNGQSYHPLTSGPPSFSRAMSPGLPSNVLELNLRNILPNGQLQISEARWSPKRMNLFGATFYVAQAVKEGVEIELPIRTENHVNENQSQLQYHPYLVPCLTERLSLVYTPGNNESKTVAFMEPDGFNRFKAELPIDGQVLSFALSPTSYPFAESSSQAITLKFNGQSDKLLSLESKGEFALEYVPHESKQRTINHRYPFDFNQSRLVAGQLHFTYPFVAKGGGRLKQDEKITLQWRDNKKQLKSKTIIWAPGANIRVASGVKISDQQTTDSMELPAITAWAANEVSPDIALPIYLVEASNGDLHLTTEYQKGNQERLRLGLDQSLFLEFCTLLLTEGFDSADPTAVQSAFKLPTFENGNSPFEEYILSLSTNGSARATLLKLDADRDNLYAFKRILSKTIGSEIIDDGWEKAYILSDTRRRKAIIKQYARQLNSENSYNYWCRQQHAYLSNIADINRYLAEAKNRAADYSASTALYYVRRAEQSYATSLLRLDREYRQKYASFIAAEKAQALYNLPSREEFWQAKLLALRDLYDRNVTTTKLNLINSLSLRVRRLDREINYSLTQQD